MNVNQQRLFLSAMAVLFFIISADVFAKDSPLRVGWVVGNADGKELQSTVSILHTRNGGRKWVEQADRTKWEGYNATDVSAVDRQTAWVSLSSLLLENGIILHTTNGGVTWEQQKMPDDVDGIKQIKGLSRLEAFAASYGGTVLHTTDGGESWNIVEHPDILITQVNRMDVIGCVDPRDQTRPAKDRLMSNANIWIVNREDGNNYGMVHSLYNGVLWREEFIPFPHPTSRVHMVAAHSPRVAWAAAWYDGTLYRTLDGGANWEAAAVISGPNDFDDMCSPSQDTLWTVQNQQTAGEIFHARVPVDGSKPAIGHWDPVHGYLYEGLTCMDDQTALVVGFTLNPSLPRGIILSTTDGGVNWKRHVAPLDDVWAWKTSFVGARR